VDLPYLPENELRQSLEFQAQDYIPIPIDQATLDFHVLEHYQTEDGQQFSRILLVAASKAQVDTLVQIAGQAKLTPVLLDLDAFAMLRSLAPRQAIEGGSGELLIDIGTSVTNIVIHEAGVPRFVRILLMGGGQITDTLVSALGMSYEQAENTKAAAQPVDSPDVPVDDADRIVVERANRFVDEIRGSLDYYAAQADAVPVRRVVITGGGSQLPGLAGRLSEALRLPVDRGHPMAELKIGNVGLAPEQLVDAEPYLTVAIGLALGAAE
jgi:type IV pilus assembly protein PilM